VLWRHVVVSHVLRTFSPMLAIITEIDPQQSKCIMPNLCVFFCNISQRHCFDISLIVPFVTIQPIYCLVYLSCSLGTIKSLSSRPSQMERIKNESPLRKLIYSITFTVINFIGNGLKSEHSFLYKHFNIHNLMLWWLFVRRYKRFMMFLIVRFTDSMQECIHFMITWNIGKLNTKWYLYLLQFYQYYRFKHGQSYYRLIFICHWNYLSNVALM